MAANAGRSSACRFPCPRRVAEFARTEIKSAAQARRTVPARARPAGGAGAPASAGAAGRTTRTTTRRSKNQSRCRASVAAQTVAPVAAAPTPTPLDDPRLRCQPGARDGSTDWPSSLPRSCRCSTQRSRRGNLRAGPGVDGAAEGVTGLGRADWEGQFAEYFAVRAHALRRLGYGLSGDWHTADDPCAL